MSFSVCNLVLRKLFSFIRFHFFKCFHQNCVNKNLDTQFCFTIFLGKQNLSTDKLSNYEIVDTITIYNYFSALTLKSHEA